MSRSGSLCVLALGTRVERQLAQRGVERVEDFGKLMYHEVRGIRGMGPNLFTRVLDALDYCDVNFLPHPDPAKNAAQENLRNYGRRSGPIGPDTKLTSLGIHFDLFEDLWRAGVRQLRDLAEWDASTLKRQIRPHQRRALLELMRQANISLAGDHSELTLWREGLLHRRDLRIKLKMRSPVSWLRPFVSGSVIRALESAGMKTVADLDRTFDALLSGQQRVRGLGPHLLQELTQVMTQVRLGYSHLTCNEATPTFVESNLLETCMRRIVLNPKRRGAR